MVNDELKTLHGCRKSCEQPKRKAGGSSGNKEEMMNWDSFYPPMFGSLLGVIGGFAANYLYQGHIADKNREKYKTSQTSSSAN